MRHSDVDDDIAHTRERRIRTSGEEDDHESIFTEYADSGAWVATHLAEFVLVLAAFSGLLVLCRSLRPASR